MPIKHHDTSSVVDTADIQQTKTSGIDIIDRVIESGNGDPIIWQRSPAVYWGLFYPEMPPGQGGTPHPDPPTGQQLLELGVEAFYSLPTFVNGSEAPGGISFRIIPLITADDWASTGTTSTLWEATGKLYVLIRSGLGNITDIVNVAAAGFSQISAFEPYTVTLNGKTYTGIVGKQALGWNGESELQTKTLSLTRPAVAVLRSCPKRLLQLSMSAVYR